MARVRMRIIRRAIDELGAEFYWEDLVEKVEELLGRELTHGERVSLAMRVRNLCVEVKMEYKGEPAQGNHSYRKIIVL